MKIFTTILSLVFCFCVAKTSAGITLIATTNAKNESVVLQWNMVNYPGSTSYSLLKSVDGIIWQMAASNPVFRNYNASTVLAYHDNFYYQKKLFYKVKVYDTNENIVEVSNTAIVNNPKNNSAQDAATLSEDLTNNNPAEPANALWLIYPNPVGQLLNIAYKGKNIIRGVISVVIQDGTGKAVVKFRAASNNKQLHINVSNLHAGLYFIRINVFNEIQMNEKFIKQ